MVLVHSTYLIPDKGVGVNCVLSNSHGVLKKTKKYNAIYNPQAKYSIKYLFQFRVLTNGLFSLALFCCWYSDLNASMFVYFSLFELSL